MNTYELTGAALALWVAKAQGLKIDGVRCAELIVGETPNRFVFRPHEDWAHGGPIIEREKINVIRLGDDTTWQAARMGGLYWVDGDTPLVAAMRVYVASVYGLDVPDEAAP